MEHVRTPERGSYENGVPVTFEELDDLLYELRWFASLKRTSDGKQEVARRGTVSSRLHLVCALMIRIAFACMVHSCDHDSVE
jgi:hypothetical protein